MGIHPKIGITGLPRSGKSAVMEKVVDMLMSERKSEILQRGGDLSEFNIIGGMRTEPLVENGERVAGSVGQSSGRWAATGFFLRRDSSQADNQIRICSGRSSITRSSRAYHPLTPSCLIVALVQDGEAIAYESLRRVRAAPHNYASV